LQDVFVAKLSGGTGDGIWSKRFGDGSEQHALHVSTDPSGNIIVSGRYYGTLDFGGMPLVQNDADADLFVARFDEFGNLIWRRGYQGTFSLHALAVDSSGRATVGGWFNGGVDFGGGIITSKGQASVFLMRLDSVGKHIWSKPFGEDAFGPIPSELVSAGADLAVNTAGEVTFTAHAKGPVNFGGGELGSTNSQNDFLTKLDSDGAHLWSRSFGEVASVGYCVVSTTPEKESVLACSASVAQIDFGAGVLVGAGGLDLVLAKFGL